MTFKKLPLDHYNRLRLSICKICNETHVDGFMFYFIRTFSEDTSVKSLFQVIEELKNGYVVSAMFGRPLEVLIDSPFVLIRTNEDISSYYHFLSMDQWCCYEIRNNKLLKIRKTPGEIFSQIGCISNLRFSPERLNDSTAYCTKSLGRLEGHWFVGIDSYRAKNSRMVLNLNLRKWQKQLLNELRSPLGDTFKARKVIWVQDPSGGAGKSTFLKWLSVSKHETGISVKKLPLDKLDRLRMMVCKII